MRDPGSAFPGLDSRTPSSAGGAPAVREARGELQGRQGGEHPCELGAYGQGSEDFYCEGHAHVKGSEDYFAYGQGLENRYLADDQGSEDFYSEGQAHVEGSQDRCCEGSAHTRGL